MAKMTFSMSRNWQKTFQDLMPKITQEVGDYERRLVIQLNERIMALTPVWEGDSIRNYVWSVGAPYFTHHDPIGTDDPGPTNKMALGKEPRRAENEAAVRSELVALLSTKLPADIYLTNSAPDIVNLEYGLNPGGPGQVSRVGQGGMVRLAIKQVIGRLK